MEKQLELVFRNDSGHQKIIAVPNPKEDLTEEVVRPVMEAILAKNVFTSTGGKLKGMVEARYHTCTTEELSEG